MEPRRPNTSCLPGTLAARQPGYLGAESARDDSGFGITVSYWRDEAAIRAWKHQAEHAATRDRGRADWYERYELRVARVERAYGWTRGGGRAGHGPGAW